MINLAIAEPEGILRPRISVIGVGGAGGNAINNMIRSSLEGCDFIAANTDAQALGMSLAPRKLQLGANLSRGLGAGSRPEIGRAAAEEQLAEIMALLEGSDMIFVTAGMGGGTGTGAAPVIARAARESGILTVGVVTKPFHFEGNHRMRQAEGGIADLQQYVDTLIVIPNQNLFRIANERTTFAEAFRLADEVLNCGVRGITDLMVMPGFMNLDFADVKTVMGEMGKAMMGTGEADGENRAVRAAEAAISNPLLDDVSMRGARGVLINVTGGLDMTLFEMDLAANRIREEVDPDAQIKVGSTLCDDLNGRIRVSVIATGIDAALEEQERNRAASSSSSGRGAPAAAIQSPPRASQTALETPVKASAIEQAAPKASALQSHHTPVAQAQQPQPPQAVPPVVSPVSQQTQADQRQTATHFPSQSQAATAPAASVSAPYFSVPPQTVNTPQVSVQASGGRAPAQEEDNNSSHRHEDVSQPRFGSVAISPAQGGFYGRQPSAPQQQVSKPQQSQQQVQAAQTQQPKPAGQSVHLRDGGQQSVQPGDTRMTQLTSSPVSVPGGAAGGINRRSQSLFTRITGFGVVRQSDMKDDEDGNEAMTPTAGRDNAPKLGVNPADRPVLSGEAPDAMEIPAFLRRQTNH